jgi:DNA processing protein
MIADRKSIIMALTDQGGVGPKTFQQLLLRMGAPENFVNASHEEFDEIPRIGPEGADKIMRSLDHLDLFKDRLDEYTGQGIDITTYLDYDYPEQLRGIDDPPPILYYKGKRDVLNHDYIALVGTTQASHDGIRLAVDLSREFVKRGYGVVSGLASGIDSAAHLGAIKEQGPTIAVLGCGIFNIYPEENESLADNIANNGLLISEYEPYKHVKAMRLVLRNRLISALAKAVVVVQVGTKRRGELRTAKYAFKQARPVFFTDPEGILEPETIQESNALLIKGAESVDEVIKYMV